MLRRARIGPRHPRTRDAKRVVRAPFQRLGSPALPPTAIHIRPLVGDHDRRSVRVGAVRDAVKRAATTLDPVRLGAELIDRPARRQAMIDALESTAGNRLLLRNPLTLLPISQRGDVAIPSQMRRESLTRSIDPRHGGRCSRPLSQSHHHRFEGQATPARCLAVAGRHLSQLVLHMRRAHHGLLASSRALRHHGGVRDR